jgi:heme A synthase
VEELLLEHGDRAVRSPAIAWTLALVTPLLWWRVLRAPDAARVRAPRRMRARDARVQVALGIATLVNVVPLPLAAAAPGGAVLLFALALNLAHASPGPLPTGRERRSCARSPPIVSGT